MSADAAGTNATGNLLLRTFGVSQDASLAGLIAVFFHSLEGLAKDQALTGEPVPGQSEQTFEHLERLDHGPDRGLALAQSGHNALLGPGDEVASTGHQC
jgi:hypothetical protein